ncbi:MAG: tripartite tricarboxylate transporter TctB family protein [Pseudomonadota bacterium]
MALRPTMRGPDKGGQAGLGPRGRDTALAAFALAVAALLAFGSIGLPPPRFEPMGSAAMPRILAGLIALFAVLILAKAWFGAAPSERSEAPVAAPPIRSVGAFAALVAYVAALDFGQAPFVPTTVLFVITMGLVLAARSWRTVLGFALLGLVLAVGIDAIFTRFLYVDLG